MDTAARYPAQYCDVVVQDELGAGISVAGGGEGFADQGVGLVAGPGVVPVQGTG